MADSETTTYKRLVIGKIPGYNVNIQKPSQSQDLKYDNRLLNNLTSVSLKPTGYSLNWTVDKTTKDNPLYKIGGHDLGGILSGIVSTGSALENWKRLVHSQILSFEFLQESTDTKNINELFILCTNDSTMSEVFSNSFEMSTTEKIANQISEINIAQISQKFRKITTIDSNLGLSLLGGTTEASAGVAAAAAGIGFNGVNASMLNTLAGKALGIQTALPEEWISSDYNNTLQLMIKLVSPSGDNASIQNYILKPLLFLILATAPLTVDGINFGYPMLWEVKADGLMDIQVAGISALTITRGGAETQFNKDNQPLNIDVRLTISPLVKGFASAMSPEMGKTSDEYAKAGDSIYQAKMMSSSPNLLSQSFGRVGTTNDNKNYHKSIKL